MYDAILFDLDGTLTDPRIGITKSIQYALSKFSIVEENLDTLISFIGEPLFECFQKYYPLGEEEARQAMDFYREYYSETGIYENAVYPAIPGLLESLHGKGKKLVLATLKPTVFAKRVLEHFEIHVFFAEVAGSNLDAAGFTKTEIIRRALILLQDIPKESIIMVGDRKHDVIGARENRIQSIAVTYGYGSIEELQEAGPTFTAGSIEDLNALLVRP